MYLSIIVLFVYNILCVNFFFMFIIYFNPKSHPVLIPSLSFSFGGLDHLQSIISSNMSKTSSSSPLITCC